MHCIARDGSTKRERDQLLRSLEESNLRYSYVTRATSDAIWDWDVKSNTLYWAQGYTEIFGHPVNGVKSDISAWTDQIHPEDRERIAASIKAVQDGQEANWKEEYRFARADGTFADVVDRGFVIRDPDMRAVRMVGAMHDISERKARIKELKQLADDLYHRNKELQQFGYVVSHNLRSPVANIMGIVTLLEIDRDDPEMIGRCIHELKSAIHRLDDVILDLSKILSITDGTTAMVREPVDVSEICKTLVSTFRSR
jgi:PAS domain S-box-containing protein